MNFHDWLLKQNGRFAAAAHINGQHTTMYDHPNMLKNTYDLVLKLGVVKELSGHNGCVNAVHWSKPYGEYLLTGSDDHLLNIYSYEQDLHMCFSFDTTHRGNVFSAKFMPYSNCTKIASCAGDGSVRFTDLITLTSYDNDLVQKPPQTNNTHTNNSTNNPMVNAFRRKDSQIRPNAFNCFYSMTYEVNVHDYDPYGFHCCSEDGTLRYFDTRMSDKCTCYNCSKWILIDNYQAITTFCIHPFNYNEIALGSEDGTVRVFDRRVCSMFGAKVSNLSAAENNTNNNLNNSNNSNSSSLYHSVDERNRLAEDYIAKLPYKCNKLPGLVYAYKPALCKMYPHIFYPRVTLNYSIYPPNLLETKLTSLVYNKNGSELLASYSPGIVVMFSTKPARNPDESEIKTHVEEVSASRLNLIPSEFRSNFNNGDNNDDNLNIYEHACKFGPFYPMLPDSEMLESLLKSYSSNDSEHHVVVEGENNNNDDAFRNLDRYNRLFDLKNVVNTLSLIDENQEKMAASTKKSVMNRFTKHRPTLDDIVNLRSYKKVMWQRQKTAKQRQIKVEPHDYSFMYESSRYDRLRNYADKVFVPEYKMSYASHGNVKTIIKEANFFGDEYIMSGSDCGNLFVWRKETGELVNVLKCDDTVVNCVQPHPVDFNLAVSGIDNTTKIISVKEDDIFPVVIPKKNESSQPEKEKEKEKEKEVDGLFERVQVRIQAAINKNKQSVSNRGMYGSSNYSTREMYLPLSMTNLFAMDRGNELPTMQMRQLRSLLPELFNIINPVPSGEMPPVPPPAAQPATNISEQDARMGFNEMSDAIMAFSSGRAANTATTVTTTGASSNNNNNSAAAAVNNTSSRADARRYVYENDTDESVNYLTDGDDTFPGGHDSYDDSYSSFDMNR